MSDNDTSRAALHIFSFYLSWKVTLYRAFDESFVGHFLCLLTVLFRTINFPKEFPIIVAYIVDHTLVFDGHLWNSNDLLINMRVSFVFHNYPFFLWQVSWST